MVDVYEFNELTEKSGFPGGLIEKLKIAEAAEGLLLLLLLL